MVKRKNIETLNENLISDFTEDIISTSDEEILEEAKELYENPIERAEKLRSSFSSLIMYCRKERNLQRAKKNLAEDKKSSVNLPKMLASWPIEKLKLLLDDTLKNEDRIPQDMIVAFRDKNELSKEDLLQLVENLYDLGLIDEIKS